MILLKVQTLSHPGFTLIELLVVILMVGILAAIAVPSFLSGLEGRKVDAVLADIEGAVREAQAEAINKSQACVLKLNTTITSDPTFCLPSGPRDLSKLGIRVLARNDSDVALGLANLGTPPEIRFSYRGTTIINNAGNTGMIVVYNPKNPNAKRRCLAVANGLGIIRTGNYLGTTPATPTDVGNCATSS